MHFCLTYLITVCKARALQKQRGTVQELLHFKQLIQLP